MTLTQRQEETLVSGGECYDHYHPEDRQPTHDTLNRLQNLAAPKTVTADYTATYNDDHILASAACTVTLPASRANKEFEVTQTGTGGVTIQLSGTETVAGSTSAAITVQWTSLRFKGITGGYLLI